MPGYPFFDVSLPASGIDVFSSRELKYPQFADGDHDRRFHPNMELVGFYKHFLLFFLRKLNSAGDRYYHKI